MKKPKIKKPKIDITNLHKLPKNEQISFFNKLESDFLKRFGILKKTLQLRNERQDDIISGTREQAQFAFKVHKEDIMKGKNIRKSIGFIHRIQIMAYRPINELLEERVDKALEEYLKVIKGQSLKDYKEAEELLNNMSPKDRSKFVKERGFFINHAYDSEGREMFDKHIADGKGNYRTDTIELYKIKYFKDKGHL